MSIQEATKNEVRVEDKSIKQLVRELIDRLPDDVSWEQLNYHLGVVEAVHEGIQSMKRGEGIPHEEVEKRLKRWLE